MKIEQADYTVDVLQSILWQYDAAEKIQTLIQKKQDWYDAQHTQFWEQWYTNVFDLSTAVAFGLSVWSIILGVPYFIQIGEDPGPIFGFNEVPLINDNMNFGNGNFSPLSGQIILNVEDQRLLLQVRYYQLISRGSRTQTNEFLNTLFNNPDGPYQGGAWMIDSLNMTIDYVFNCPISDSLLNVFKLYDVLPRPSGVRIANYFVT